MMFLIAKIFIYILLAGTVGGVAGWLFRNLQAQRTEENAQRAANDAKAKLPQLESLLRGRDEQLAKLKEILHEQKAELSERTQDIREMEVKLRNQEKEIHRWQESAQARQTVGIDGEVLDGDGLECFDIAADDSGETDSLIAELSAEISRLKSELSQVENRGGTATGTEDESLLKMELEALRAQLANAERELEIARTDLSSEQHKVAELERERELQNKSLQVLHQQLDLERTRRVAAG